MIPITNELFEKYHAYLSTEFEKYTTQARALMDHDHRQAEVNVLLANVVQNAGMKFNEYVRDEMERLEHAMAKAGVQ